MKHKKKIKPPKPSAPTQLGDKQAFIDRYNKKSDDEDKGLDRDTLIKTTKPPRP